METQPVAEAKNRNNIYKNETLEHVMKDLEQKVNPKNMAEGINLLNNPVKIISSMQSGAKEFEERVGRPMTYSEMRAMWG